MRFTINPITDEFDVVGLGSGVFAETITGNTGGAVPPDGSGNISLLGVNSTGITVVGSPGTSTLQIFGIASTTTQVGTTRYATNAEAAAQSSTTSALTPSNITSMFSTFPVPSSQGGTGLSSPAAHSLIVTNGSSAFTVLGTAGNGQLPIGSVGGDPVLANILSADSSVTITNGPGTINLAVAGGATVVKTLTGNSGGAISPTAGNINTVGTGSITIAGAGSTLTTQLTGLTSHAVQIGAGTATLTQLGPTSTAGQVLQSAGASADPAFSTATYPLTTTINQILFSSAANTVTGLATANNGVLTTGATGIPVITALSANGQLIIGSGSGAPTAATITPGAGISVTNAANSITIAATGAGFTWADKATNFNAVAENGYFVTGTTAATLPASPSEGDTISFIDDDTNILTVTANTGQKIRIGSALSASAGTAANNARGDALEIVYRTTGTTWFAKSVIGTWTVT